MLSRRLKQFLYLVITRKVEKIMKKRLPGSLDTHWRGAGAHLHGEGATVGSGALELVLFCFFFVLFCLMIMVAVKHYDCENDYIQCVVSFKNLKRTSIL